MRPRSRRILVALLVAVVCGVLWASLWSLRSERALDRFALAEPPEPPPRAEVADDAMLDALGYTEGQVRAGPASGVLVHDRGAAMPGLNLYASGDGPVVLMDLDGAVLHTWSMSMDEAFPGRSLPDKASVRRRFRRVHLLDGGGLLGIFEGFGIVRLDRDSRVVWAAFNRAHHDLDVDADGTVLVLTRKLALRPSLSLSKFVVEDYVTRLDLESGARVEEWSLLEAIWDAAPGDGFPIRGRTGDLMHTNTLQILDGRGSEVHPGFAAGNILVSLRNQSALAVVDLHEGRVVWSARGIFEKQHEPSVVDGARLLLFDNVGADEGSRVLEVELPDARRPVWLWPGQSGYSLDSPTRGTVRRLPNGNTLITETDRGRAVEVDRTGFVVWEYVNPGRIGPRKKRVAVIQEMIRLPVDLSVDWVQRGPPL